MSPRVGPLSWHIPIVNKAGVPTAEFIRKWNQQQAANAIIPDLSTPAEVSAVLDVLSAVPNSLILRGASQWGPLTAPSDSTKFLNGAGPPAWANVKDSDLALSDIVGNNVTNLLHGFAPKTLSDATKFLNGAASPTYAQVKDSDLSTSDITTNNATTAKHGFVPKLPNDATKYYDGTGAYSTPAGGGGGGGGLIDMSAGVPLASAFSLINIGGATLVDSSPTKKALIFTVPTVTGTNHRIISKAKPSTPYRVAAMIKPAIAPAAAAFIVYLGFRNTTTGHFEGVGILISAAAPKLEIDSYTSPTAFNTTPLAASFFPEAGDWMLGIRDDGTNHFYEFSADGVQWATLLTAANSGWFVNASSTYDAVAVDVGNNAAGTAIVSLRLWDENGLTRNYP